MARARQTISQRIALEGSEQVLKELAALGKGGEAAAAQLKKAFEQQAGLGANFSGAIRALKDQFGQLGTAVGVFKRSLDDVGTASLGVIKNVTKIVAAATVAATAILLISKSAAAAADNANKNAQQIGLSVTQYGRLQFAAEQSRIPVEQFVSTMDRFNKNIVEASKGNKTLATAFKSIGVSVKDASGRLKPTSDILLNIAEAFQKMPDGAKKAALAIAFFGKGGAELIPLLNQGAEGILALGDQAERLGLTFTKAQVAIGGALNDALGRLGRTIKATKDQLGLLFAPAITAGADALTNVIAERRGQLLAFVEDIVQRAIPVIRDLINAVTGNDAAVTSSFILEWRDSIIQFGQAVVSVIAGILIPAFNALRDVAGKVADAINGVFGTNFNAEQVLAVVAIGKVIGAFDVAAASVRAVSAAVTILGILLGGPVWVAFAAVITAAGIAIALLSSKTDAAAAAVKAHAASMEELRSKMADVKNGVPGATEAYRKFSQELLENAKQAVKTAQQQADALTKLRDSQSGNWMWSRSAEGLTALKDLDQANLILKQKMLELQDVQTQIASVGNEAVATVSHTIRSVADAIQPASDSVNELNTTVTILRGSAGATTQEIVSVGQAARDSFVAAGEAAQTTGQQINATLTPIGGFTEQVRQAADGILRAWDGSGTILRDTSLAAGDLSTGLANVGNAAAGVGSQIAEVGQSLDTQALADGANATVSALTDAQAAAQSTIEAITVSADQASAAWLKVSDGIGQTVTAAQTAATAILGSFSGLTSQISSKLAPLPALVKSVFTQIAATIKSQMNGAFQAVTGLIANLTAQLNSLRAAIIAAQAAASSSGAGVGRATGGPIRGAGSGTSDSILSWLSDGEFVIRADAVKHYGTRFFAMLNSMRLPKGGFNLGGLADSVSSALGGVRPRFALGGLVGASAAAASGASGRPINLHIDGESFLGLIAPETVAERLGQFASRKRIRRSGTKPSWYE